MSEPFIGEICAFPYANLYPEYWLACDGTTYPIMQYQALAAVIGNKFGGNGSSTFQVPDLSGRVPIAQGRAPGGRGVTDFAFAQAVGANAEQAWWPLHTHNVLKHPPKTAGIAQKVATPSPTTELAQLSSADGTVNYNIFSPNNACNSVLSVNSLTPFQGSSQLHENRQPYLALRFFIAWQGIFPTRD